MKQAVCGIIFNRERTEVLLIQRRDIPVWTLPGGGIDPGETPENAAVREIQEETGYEAAIVRKVAEYLPVNRFTQPTHFYECSIVSGIATTGIETKQIRFFPLADLPKLLSVPYKSWIEDAQKNDPEILCKKVEGVSYFVFIKLLILHPILVSRYLLTKLGIHLNSNS